VPSNSRQGNFVVTAMRRLEACHHTGHRNRARTIKIAVVLHPRPREEIRGRAFARQRIILAADAAGRQHAEVDHFIAVFARAIQQPSPRRPPMPLIQGSSTPSANEVATTAVDTVPACRQHLSDDFGCLRDCAATMPPLETAAGCGLVGRC